MLPYEPVDGCLEWVAHTARRRMPLTRRRGQIRGDPVRQRAPESRTGPARLGHLYSKVVCFNVFNLEFMGINDSGHGVPPWPRMLPIRYGGCLLRSKPVHKYWCGVEGGTVLNYHLSDTICIVMSKKRN